MSTSTNLKITNGIPVYSSNVAFVKGSYVEIIASTTDDAKGFFLSVFGSKNQDLVITYTFDVAIGKAGNEDIIVADANVNFSTLVFPVYTTYFPGKIKSGTRISIRQSDNAGIHQPQGRNLNYGLQTVSPFQL